MRNRTNARQCFNHALRQPLLRAISQLREKRNSTLFHVPSFSSKKYLDHHE